MRRTAPLLILLWLLASAVGAGAQPSGPLDMAPRAGLTIAASDGRVLYVDARLVPAGRYYFAVTVDVARDPGAAREALSFSPDAFRFVTRAGFIFAPASLARLGPTTPPAGRPCERVYLPPGGAITCDLAFEVPTEVSAGILEFVVTAFDVWAGPIRIRE